MTAAEAPRPLTPRQLSARINTLRKERVKARLGGRTTTANRIERELRALVTERMRRAQENGNA